jgi:ribonuclease Z
MATAVILGSSFAIPDETHENTHLVLLGPKNGAVLIDTAGQTVLRLKKAGIDHNQLGHLILTHFHPDHVYGAPMFIMEMWLRGRKAPLQIHGLQHCMDRMELVMNAFEWYDWPRLFPVSFHAVELAPEALVLENDDFLITGMPVSHFIPTMGLRIMDKATGRVLAYSCDTEPCENVTRLARNADVLLHEAAGAGLGHTSAAQAAKLAQEVGAKQLALIHYRTGDGVDPEALIPEAQAIYSGPVLLAKDFMRLEW